MALFVTYLQPDLLERMDKTEGAYNLCQLTEVQLQIGLGLQDYRCTFTLNLALYLCLQVHPSITRSCPPFLTPISPPKAKSIKCILRPYPPSPPPPSPPPFLFPCVFLGPGDPAGTMETVCSLEREDLHLPGSL